jgi:hypothetical protein
VALGLLPSREPIVLFGIVSFFMSDEEKVVRVDIGQDLLSSIDGAPPARSRDGYIDRCERHRGFFAQLAARKYKAGQYMKEVKVLVVRITEEDLA